MKWRNKKQLNSIAKLDKDKIKDSHEVKAYRTALLKTLNINRCQNDGENISMWTKIKKSVTKTVENLRIVKINKKPMV